MAMPDPSRRAKPPSVPPTMAPVLTGAPPSCPRAEAGAVGEENVFGVWDES